MTGDYLQLGSAVTPSPQLLAPLSSFGSIDRVFDEFASPAPSLVSAVRSGPEVVTLSDSEEDSSAPPMGRPKTHLLHIRAGVTLRRLLEETPADPLPIPVQTFDTHTPSTMY